MSEKKYRLLTPRAIGAVALVRVQTSPKDAATLLEQLTGRHKTPAEMALLRLNLGDNLFERAIVRYKETSATDCRIDFYIHGGLRLVARLEQRLQENGFEEGHFSATPELGTEGEAALMAAPSLKAVELVVARYLPDGTPKNAGKNETLFKKLMTPPLVAIVGAPNVGKSALLNTLLGRERVLVSPEAGTTRDPVLERVQVEGFAIDFLDTAGLGVPRDELDKEAQRRTLDRLARCDAVLLLLDQSCPLAEQENFFQHLVGKTVFSVLNKIDLPEKLNLATLPESLHPQSRISLLTGSGLDLFRKQLLEFLFGKMI